MCAGVHCSGIEGDSMSSQTLVFIDHNYPSPRMPGAHAFSQEICHAYARHGLRVVVVSPVAWPRSCRRKDYPYHQVEVQHPDGGCVEIFRPTRLTFSSKLIFPRLNALNPWWVSFRLFAYAVIQTLKKHSIQPDVAVGMFYYLGGGGAIEVGKAFGCPSYIEVGEGEFWTTKGFDDRFIAKHLKQATGLIPNGSHLARRSIKKFGLPPEKFHVLTNGIDLSVFHPLDKTESRKRFGFPLDKFIVGAVGNFLYKKGICRTAEAIVGMKGVVGVFAGSGPMPPKGDNVIFAQRVLHHDLPSFYSACDVFVLPTLVEGCCNAIQEALACGVPVITANGEHVADITNADCAIHVDPLDIAAIRQAVLTLQRDHNLRERMSISALKKGRSFDMNNRIRDVVQIEFGG